MLLIRYHRMQFVTDHHPIMSSLMQWKGSHLCNPLLCSLIQVICRLVDTKCSRENTVSFILVSNKTLLFFMFINVLLIRMHTTRFQGLSLISYKKKLKLSFLVLENNDAIIQLSWGIEGAG